MARYYDQMLRNGKVEYRVFDETSCLYYSFYHNQVTPLCDDVEECIQQIVESEEQYMRPADATAREKLANSLRQHGPYMIYDLDGFFEWIGALQSRRISPYEAITKEELDALHAAADYLKRECELQQKPSNFFDIEAFFQTIHRLTRQSEGTRESLLLGFTAQYVRGVEDAYRCYEVRKTIPFSIKGVCHDRV